MPFLSQGLCTNELRTVIFLSGAITSNVYWWLWPFHKIRVTTGKSTSASQISSSTPSKLVFLPVASSEACTFSITLPVHVASILLSREMSQCLTQGQLERSGTNIDEFLPCWLNSARALNGSQSLARSTTESWCRYHTAHAGKWEGSR